MNFDMSYNTTLKDIQEVKKLLDLFKNPKGLVLVYDINGKVFKRLITNISIQADNKDIYYVKINAKEVLYTFGVGGLLMELPCEFETSYGDFPVILKIMGV